MSNQVAGHDTFYTLGNTLIKTTTQKEADFYKNISEYPQYDQFTPDCKIITSTESTESNETTEYNNRSHVNNINNKKDKCIYLENLTWGMKQPCVMDIKLGVKNYRDHATIERIAKNIIKANISTTAKWGLRIAGYKLWDIKDKHQCRELSIRQVKDTLHDFLINNQLKTIAKTNIKTILESLVDNHEFRLYGSSILFVYDRDDPINTLEIRLIDFSNYYKLKSLEEQDDGYIFGLKNLYSLL